MLATVGLLLAVAAAPFPARVVGVVDGDSVRVATSTQQQLEIRLDGIDAPELGQDFGRRAKQHTSDLLFKREVEVEPKGLDRYGRTVARVRVGGKDASVEIIRAGYAWHFVKYSSDPELAAAERQARSEHRGLWADAAPVAPWDYRGGRVLTPEGAPAFRGNASSRVYHRAGCPHYSCRSCTVPFDTAAAAQAAGFRPARCCNK